MKKSEMITIYPNPLCNGYVIKKQRLCLSCGCDLDICQKCGEIIVKMMERCGYCGYEINVASNILYDRKGFTKYIKTGE